MNTDEFKQDMAAIVSDLPLLFAFSGSNYTGTQTALAQTEELMAGGFVGEPDLSLHVPLYTASGTNWVPTFTTEPGVGDHLVTASGTYSVGRTTRSPDGVELVLELKTVNR